MVVPGGAGWCRGVMAGGSGVKFRVRRHLAWLYIVAPHVPSRFVTVLFLGLPGILGISPPMKCGPTQLFPVFRKTGIVTPIYRGRGV